MTASTERTSPLAAWAGRFAAASASTACFSIRELRFTTQLNLRGNPTDSAFVAALRGALGFAPPSDANTFGGDAERGAIWLGPDEWLLTAPDVEGESLQRALREALRGLQYSLVDVSANRTVIEIAGRDARPVLAKGCSLDLHARAFAPPQAAQTLLAKASVILQCVSVAPVFRVYVRNSFADYLARWLGDAAAESKSSSLIDGERIAARLAERRQSLLRD